MKVIPKFLQKLESSLLRTKDELENKQREFDQQLLKAQELQGRIQGLRAEVNRYSDQLARADDQFNSLKEPLRTLKEAVLTGWGDPNGWGPPSYQNIVALEGAIADYPRVRASILANLETTKATLAELEAQLPE